jgi:hypothetical protein
MSTQTFTYKGTTTIGVEKEIELPAYYGHGFNIIKFDGEKTIVVSLPWKAELGGILLFSPYPCWFQNVLKDGAPVAPEYFNEVYNEALEAIKAEGGTQ